MNHKIFYIPSIDVLLKEVTLILLAEILFRQEYCNFLVNLCYKLHILCQDEFSRGLISKLAFNF